MKLSKISDLLGSIKENPYVFIVLALGLVLLLLPSEKQESTAAVQTEERLSAPVYSLESEEQRLQKALENISGVGKTKVLLSLKSTAKRNLAMSGDEAVVLSAGSGKQQAVEEGFAYPEYLGAVVVCQGAGSADVRMDVYDAVSAFTGLSMADIRVLKME